MMLHSGYAMGWSENDVTLGLCPCVTSFSDPPQEVNKSDIYRQLSLTMILSFKEVRTYRQLLSQFVSCEKFFLKTFCETYQMNLYGEGKTNIVFIF